MRWFLHAILALALSMNLSRRFRWSVGGSVFIADRYGGVFGIVFSYYLHQISTPLELIGVVVVID